MFERFRLRNVQKLSFRALVGIDGSRVLKTIRVFGLGITSR